MKYRLTRPGGRILAILASLEGFSDVCSGWIGDSSFIDGQL